MSLGSFLAHLVTGVSVQKQDANGNWVEAEDVSIWDRMDMGYACDQADKMTVKQLKDAAKAAERVKHNFKA